MPQPIQAIEYSFTRALDLVGGPASSDFSAMAEGLERARRTVLAEADTGQRIDRSGPSEDFDYAFVNKPADLLAAYQSERSKSELARIIATAQRLRHEVDRVVVLGIGGSYMGAKALFDALCHPYHNELPRAGRGSYPRLYFEGNNVDNDAATGLLDLLPHECKAATAEGRWALVVISKSGETMETAVSFRLFLTALTHACGGNREELARLLVPITGETGRLRNLTTQLGLGDDETFRVPDAVGGRYSIFTPVGLLPAAIVGIDVVRLLQGAAFLTERFRTLPPGQNPVLDYVGLSRLWEERGASIRVLSTWGKRLESAGLWYDQLLSESLGKLERGPTPLTTVNTRDLHSRGQQHQQGRRDKLITNFRARCSRTDPLVIQHSERNEDRLNSYAGLSLDEVLNAAFCGINDAYQTDGRPTADLDLPSLDPASLGQFFQMMMLATAVEGRLVGTNPYGQPGVKMYKDNMVRYMQARAAESDL